MSCTNPPPARITPPPLPPTNYARPTKQPPWCRETSSRPSFRVLEREGSARSLLRPAWSTFLVNWITIRDVISDILYLSWDEAWRQNISIHINEKGKKMYKSVLNVCAFFFLVSMKIVSWKRKVSDTNIILLY